MQYSNSRAAPLNSLRRTVTGRTYQDCIRKLYKDHGTGYTILRRGTIFKGGFLGIGQHEEVELEYTVSESFQEGRRYAEGDASSDERTSFLKKRDEILKAVATTARAGDISAKLDAKFAEMQDAMLRQLQNISASSAEKHATIKRIDELLEENEFTPSYIAEIEAKIKGKFPLAELDDFNAVEKQVVDWIGGDILVAPAREPRPPHVVIIVGPTGVGKTTTLAKLAAKKLKDASEAHYKIPEFCFVTTDSMRVGALEQIERFGDSLQVVVEKAESADDLKKIYDEKKGRMDAIFIDTSGYSPNDAERIAKMKDLLAVRGMHSDVYLAVAASTKARDLAKIMENYAPLSYESVIVTKCDESPQLGNVMSVLHEKNKKIAYTTNGQHVFNNIKRASVVDMLASLTGFNMDTMHIADEFEKDKRIGE